MPRQCRSYKRVRASNGNLVRRCAKYKTRSRHRRSARRHPSTPGCTRFKRVYSSAYGKKIWRCAKRRSVMSRRVTTYVTPSNVVPLLAPAAQPPAWLQPAQPPQPALVDLLQQSGVPQNEAAVLVEHVQTRDTPLVEVAISKQVVRRLRDQMRRLRPSGMPAALMSRYPQNRPKVRR